MVDRRAKLLREAVPSSFPLNLRPPPAHSDKQKAPVVEKLRRLALKSVPNELEKPSHHKQRHSIQPQPVQENAGDKNWHREQDGRNPQGVTETVYRMPVTGSILRDPLLVAASAQHAEDNITTMDA